MHVEVRTEIVVRRAQVAEQTVNVAIHFGSDAVNLDAIAGRKQDHFFESTPNFQAAPGAAQGGRRDGNSLAQFYRRGFVTESCDKNFHAFPVSARSDTPASSADEFRQSVDLRLRIGCTLLCIL